MNIEAGHALPRSDLDRSERGRHTGRVIYSSACLLATGAQVVIVEFTRKVGWSKVHHSALGAQVFTASCAEHVASAGVLVTPLLDKRIGAHSVRFLPVSLGIEQVGFVDFLQLDLVEVSTLFEHTLPLSLDV